MCTSEIDNVIHNELKRLHGEIVEFWIRGVNFCPVGILDVYEDDTGKVLLRPSSYHVSTSFKTICLDASEIVMIAHRHNPEN
jgi:hypothetical protein